jgi:hypothetical protein
VKKGKKQEVKAKKRKEKPNQEEEETWEEGEKEKTKSGKEKYPCSTCGKTFSKRTSVKRHQDESCPLKDDNQEHPIQEEEYYQVELEHSIFSSSSEQFSDKLSCDICLGEFTRMSSLQRHFERKHPSITRGDPGFPSKYSDPFALASFVEAVLDETETEGNEKNKLGYNYHCRIDEPFLCLSKRVFTLN